MGFFSSSEDTVKVPPNKSKRLECWGARDTFFQCLTTNDIDNSLDPKEQSKVEQQCGKERTDFKNKCVASWFTYFQEKRYNDLLREKYIKKLQDEGAQELPFKLGPR